MISVRNIDNPFKPEEAKVLEFTYSRSKSVREYLDNSGFDYKDKRVIVTGKRIEDLDSRIEEGDEIVVAPEVQAPVVAVISFIISAVWAAAVAHPFLFTFFVLSMGYSIYQYMNQPKMPDFNLGSAGMVEGSPTDGTGCRRFRRSVFRWLSFTESIVSAVISSISFFGRTAISTT